VRRPGAARPGRYAGAVKSEVFRTDPLFLRNQQFMTGRFEMPFVYSQIVDLEGLDLLGFDKTRRFELSGKRRAASVHFFLDDYKFDQVWNSPAKQVARLAQYAQVLSPDFSVYADMPEPLQIFNTFRNRWCASVWQAAKMVVIPTISWGAENTFEFAFEGVEQGAAVAISTVGTSQYVAGFMAGFEQMCQVLEPRAVVVYGELYPGMSNLAETVVVPYEHGSFAGRD
jgi:hypothetical protein